MDNTQVSPNVARNRPGATQETNAPGAPPEKARPNEVWRHPGSGQTAILQWDPLYGSAQHAAFQRVGFEYLRDAKPEEVTSLEAASISAENSKLRNNASVEDVKNVLARVQALEAENERLKAAQTATPTETELAGEKAKQAATQKTEERGTDNSGDVASSGGVNATVSEADKKGSK